MSSSVYAIVTSPISAADVAEAIKQGYGSDDVVISPVRDDIQMLVFTQPDGKGRSMHVYLDGACKGDYSAIYQGDATLLSLGNSGDSIAIMKAVLERHGGYLVRDYDMENPEFIHPVQAMSPEELMNSRIERAASLGCAAALRSLALDGLHVDDLDPNALGEAFKAALKDALVLDNQPSPPAP